jgi:hypothetical protein
MGVAASSAHELLISVTHRCTVARTTTRCSWHKAVKVCTGSSDLSWGTLQLHACVCRRPCARHCWALPLRPAKTAPSWGWRHVFLAHTQHLHAPHRPSMYGTPLVTGCHACCAHRSNSTLCTQCHACQWQPQRTAASCSCTTRQLATPTTVTAITPALWLWVHTGRAPPSIPAGLGTGSTLSGSN